MAASADQAAVDLAVAVEHDDVAAVRAALAAGGDPGRRDAEDWNALDRAAGRGCTPVVEVLLAAGADPTASGADQRTPYQIALAAGHREAASRLRVAEEEADPASAQRHEWRPYCRAYLLDDVRRFPGWPREAENISGDRLDSGQDLLAEAGVVFIHDDLRVTRSMWRETGVVFDGAIEGWAAFCADQLGFRVPDDFDLIPQASRPA